MAVVAVGLAGFVTDCAAAAVVAGYFVADLGFAGCFVDAADLDCVVDFAVAVVAAVSVGLAVDY